MPVKVYVSIDPSLTRHPSVPMLAAGNPTNEDLVDDLTATLAALKVSYGQLDKIQALQPTP